MSAFLKAADDARRLLRGFKAFEEVATALESAGKAEQTKAEAESKLAFLLVQIETAKIEAAEQVAQNAAMLAEAQKQAEQITAAASAKAMALVADAQTQAVNIELAAEGVKAKAQALLAQAQAEVDQAADKRAALAAECDALEKRADKARAYLSKLAG